MIRTETTTQKVRQKSFRYVKRGKRQNLNITRLKSYRNRIRLSEECEGEKEEKGTVVTFTVTKK